MFRLSIVMVLVLATVALGFIAYTANQPKPVAQAPADVQKAPAPGYFFAAHPLPTGTFVRDEDFEVRAAPLSDVPSGAILESPAARIELRGSLVRNFVEAGRPITSRDVLRPRDRGFVASVLAPDTRAISINVDTESGVSGLIWPGDYVDVLLTQTSDKEDRARHALSEILVHNVRIIAIDQETVEGVLGASAVAEKIVDRVTGASAEPRKVARSVSLELSPEQVKKITLAKDLGKLSLAVRSADEVSDAADSGAPLAVRPANAEDAVDSGATFGRDVSPEIARQQDAEIARLYAEDARKDDEVARKDAEIARKEARHDAEVARKDAEIALQNARQDAMARQITTVVVYEKGHCREYTVRKQGFSDAGLVMGCRGYPETARISAALADANSEKAKE
jgi:pilus assembly protein CpaB